MRRYIPLLLVLIASCGEGPMFEGTEFHFVIGEEEETVTVDEPARKCDFVNDGQGWGVDTDDFGFYVADIAPGTYRLEQYDGYGESDFVLDGEAAGFRFSTSSSVCEEGVTMTIEGADYGLIYGTVTGSICSGGTKDLRATFAFATRNSGDVRCPQ